MAQSAFSLSWESHRNNICDGLSVLQQNGEFVDMTLAADGHHVKVHQMVMALASPYIKELITSANCPHPVIYLNKISYVTLNAILEYIYTGEVLVSIENLNDLLCVARELHIKGLEEMNIHDSITAPFKQPPVNAEESVENMEDEIYFQVGTQEISPTDRNNYTVDESITEDDKSISIVEGVEHTFEESEGSVANESMDKKERILGPTQEINNSTNPGQVSTILQYTISNQGSLQIVVNRFLYYLKYVNRNGSRQWRCVDYLNSRKCPAIVLTNNDVVLKRISAHNHPFHDKRILAKVRAGALFPSLLDAESRGKVHKSRSTKDAETTATENIL